MALRLEDNVSLASLSTLRVGGNAERLVYIESEEALLEALDLAYKQAWPVTVLGGGSNVLISDQGIGGLVLVMAISGEMVKKDDDVTFLTAGAGVRLDDLVARSVEAGLWGLENLSGIPGTVGATPIQNVGAYGVEMADLIYTVRVYDRQSESFKNLTNSECEFAYRDSVFKHEPGHYIITAVTFRLANKPTPRLYYRDLLEYFSNGQTPDGQSVRQAVLTIRARKFPDLNQVGTAGSFFKNPVITLAESRRLKERWPDLPVFPVSSTKAKISLGFVLDKIMGLRGTRKGDVGLYEGQVLVLVAYEGATFESIKKFADEITEQVKRVVGLTIEPEVTYLSRSK